MSIKHLCQKWKFSFRFYITCTQSTWIKYTSTVFSSPVSIYSVFTPATYIYFNQWKIEKNGRLHNSYYFWLFFTLFVAVFFKKSWLFFFFLSSFSKQRKRQEQNFPKITPLFRKKIQYYVWLAKDLHPHHLKLVLGLPQGLLPCLTFL